jgi:hypothetical protein
MICVCHRCSRDLNLQLCQQCIERNVGPECRFAACPTHGGHYCHSCLEVHLREDRILAQRHEEKGQIPFIGFAATSRVKEK